MAGVNPYITEIDLINGVQNPVFGIVKSVMLTGLSREDSDRMISRIGRQMGLLFEERALSYLHSRYGGHPLLTRMACSYTNQELVAKNAERPTQILEKHLKDREADRDSELQFYCRHIVSELKEFYKAEYDILLMLAEGSVVDVIELSAEPEWTKHLKGYGVLNFSQAARPSFKIPVLERYLAYETARERGTNEPRNILPAEQRAEWLQRRKSGIISEYRSLLKALLAAGKVLPYGSEFLPESHRISECKESRSWDDFVGFITSINLALCETIDDAHGKGYFFGGLKTDYTSLFNALLRIRTYRNNADHLRLNRAAESAFRQFIEVDFRGRELSAVKDPWFALQQVALDELFGALLIEINRLR